MSDAVSKTKDHDARNWRKSWEGLAKASHTKAFTEQLDDEALKFFNMVATKNFQEQAVYFLNAYWPEIGSQAEFIYTVAWELIKRSEMHHQGISLIHKYKEGNDLDFDIGLYFYEQLSKFVGEDKNKSWAADEWKASQPTMMTAIKRKQQLRDKVDVNFDGRVSFLEYLLDQYSEHANPADFVLRSMGTDEHPEIAKARKALEEVNKRVQEYEAEKSRLETESQKDGVKGLGAKNQLAQLESSPLWDAINTALITAEAAVRIACKKFGGQVNATRADGSTVTGTAGALWWMDRDLKEKKARYGKKSSK